MDNETAVHILADGTITSVTPRDGRRFKLDDLYAWIESDDIDIIPMYDGHCMVVAKDTDTVVRKPVNAAATRC